MNNFHYRTLAMAGVIRSAVLVQQLSTQGSLKDSVLRTCVDSIFCTSPATPLDVFGSISNVSSGLKGLIDQFGSDTTHRNIDVARYVVSILFLERRLAQKPAVLATLSSGIELAIRQSEHFTATHENVIANLADLYGKTISEIGPRIMVNGEQQYLSNPATANQVRTLLLSGIRCAVLWHQLGGRRWHILFQR
ncbi:MAG: high frequency lysogenization protein HflD, partial [Gammaproteobacteria bacterium]|nr:high frequency lysogenization protein HflD [Gammaproteobacteria bacterium]